MSQGWICLHRQMLEWEWYSDVNTTRLFIHCLLKANHKDKKWQGKVIPRGSFITGRNVLSDETGLTVRQIRTALDKLKSTNDLTIKATNKNSLVTVVNYDFYQDVDNKTTSKTTNKRPNERPTDDHQTTTTNNDNNETMITNKDILPNGNSENAKHCSPKQVMDLYNEKFKGLYPRQMRELTANRQATIRTRIKNDISDLEEWGQFFDWLKQSDFLMGRVQGFNRKPFQMSLDWICKAENMANILEDKYHGK